jgi:uncharacterized protein (DUF305 family)
MRLTLLWIAAGVVLTVTVLAVAACGGGNGGAGTNATPTGADFDRAFIDAMVPHHDGAIAMAQAAKKARLAQPELVKIADDILKTQRAEIDKMKAWRGEWFGSSKIDPKGAKALGLSESQMGMQHDADALMDSADVDTDFAQMMITHHQGAIAMAELAKDHAEHEEIKELARAITEAQGREIKVMRDHASGVMDHG